MADISLLFDVAGGGKLSGESGGLIQQQIQEIVNNINKTPLEIKFQANEESLTLMQSRIKELTKDLNLGFLSANSSGLSGLSTNFAKITQDVTNVSGALHNMQVAVGTSNITAIKNALSGLGTGISATAITDIASRFGELNLTITKVRPQISDLGKETARVTSLMITGVDSAGNTINQKLKFDNKGKLITDLSDIVIKLAEIEQKSKSAGSSGQIGAQKLSDEFKKMRSAVKDYYDAVKEAQTAGWAVKNTDPENNTGMWFSTEAGYDERVNKLNRVTAACNSAMEASAGLSQAERKLFTDYVTTQAENYRIALEKNKLTLEDMKSSAVGFGKTIADSATKLSKCSAAATSSNAKVRQEYKDLDEAINNARVAQKTFQNNMTPENFQSYADAIDVVKTKTRQAEATFKETGYATKTFGERIAGLAKKFTQWFSVSQVIMAIYRQFKKMVEAVREIDTAMIELKKVTDETDATYERFLTNATSRAKKFGATISDVVNASANFAKLGYSIEDAEKLADAAIVYKNVGDGIEDIDTASESIIATMQAFGISAEDAMLIVDKFNEVGNNYAISSVGVGDALLRSAAAMHAANNSLDETIALAAASNTIIQDPEKVGTTLKTVSMYLRAAKTEAEAAGESTDGMAGSVSELREEILALTGNKVDIQIDEDTFKGTYQILKELSVVWSDLSDITQANILEMVGGKRNANVVAAILENFTIAEKAVQTSAESAGSALVENEKYLTGIEGHISKFKATFEELSTTFLDSELVKGVVDIGTGLLNVLNIIGNLINVLGGLKTVLVGLAGTLVVLKLHSIPKLITAIITPIKSLIGFLGKVKTAMATYKAMTAAMKNTNSAALITYGQSTSALARLSAAFKAAGISASTAQIAVAAFMAALTVTIGAVQKYKQSQEEARQAAADSASAVSDNTTKLNEYKDKISDLRFALDKNTLSETEAYDARKQLIEIEQSLIELFGKEAEGIDLVTGSVNNQIDALSRLSESQWNTYKQEHSGAIDDAVKLFTEQYNTSANSNGAVNIPHQKYIYEMMESLYPSATKAEIRQYVADYYDTLITKIEEAIPNAKVTAFNSNSTVGRGYAYIDGLGDNIYDYLSSYESIYNIIEEITKSYVGTDNYREYVSVALEGVSKVINGIKGDIKENEDIFNTYVEGLLLYEKEYAGIYSKALAAKKEYDDAVLSGDDTAVAAALQKMKGVQNEFLNAGWDNEAVNLYMNDFFDAFNVAAQQRKGLIEIKTVLEDPKDAATKAAVKAAQTFADESGKISMEAILNAGIDYEKTGDATSEQAKAYIELKTLADKYGLSVESVIGVMNGLGLITVKALKAPVDDFDKAKTAATSFLTSLQGVQGILSSQMAGRSISIEDFNAEGMEDYRSALEYTNGAMQLNAEKVREITEAKAAEEKQTIATNKALDQEQYLKNAKQIEEYRKKLAEANYEGDETEKSVRESISALLDENSALADTCKQYDLLSASITEATSAYSHWLNSQNASDYGDMANDAVSAIQKIRNTYDSDSEDYGNFGSKKFDAAVDFIVPDTVDQDDLAAVESYMNSFQQYLSFDENGSVTGLNIDQFLSNAVEAGLMSYSEDDGFQILGGKKMEDFAKGLNMSSGMVTAFFDELQLKGADFDWGDEGVKTFGDLAVEANEAAEALRLVEANKDLKIKLDVSDLATTEEQVNALDTTIASMNTIRSRVNVSAEDVEYANSVIQYCIAQKQLLTQPDVMRVDTSQCEDDVANVVKLLQDFQTAQNNLEIQQALGMDTTEAQTKVDGLYKSIQNLKPKIKTELGIDTISLKSLQTSLAKVTANVLVNYGVNEEAVKGYNPESKSCDVVYNPKTDLLPKSFEDINVSVYYDPDVEDLPESFKTITRYVNYVAIGQGMVQGTAHAGGTAAAGGDWGTAAGGHTLVGELGREIVVDPRTGRWYTVGDNGAEFVNIPAGAIVFNHIQTESLLNNGYVAGRAAALVSGTAMVTGGYKPYKPTGGYSGGTGGGYSGSSGSSGNNSSSSTSTNSSSDKEESWFEKQYKLHNHLVNMNRETDEEYLTWLANAYKKAYNEGIIELDDYRKYAEEVYTGLQELFEDYLDDVEHEISMRENFDSETTTIIAMYRGLMKDVEKEIAAARAAGLDDSDEYIQNLQDRWWEYSDAITEIQEDTAEAAKDAVDELVEYRIDMIKQELEDEKDALDKKLDYLKEFYDKQKELLQDQYDEEQYLEEQSEKRKTVTDLKSELAMLENDDSAWAQKRSLELQAELSDAEDDLGNFEDEHALDLVLDNLESAYEAQEKEIQAQKDALDEVLNNPEALYNKALSDIQKTAKDQLYYQMLEYNAQHGDGNPETVNEIWENAYGALTEYQKLFGELYKNIEIGNATGVKDDTDGWDDSNISDKNNKEKTSTNKKKSTETYPYGKASATSGNIQQGARGSGVKAIQYALNKLGYGNSGTKDVDGIFGSGTASAVKAFQKAMGITQDGIVGKNTRAKFKSKGYASGTKHATAGLHELYERGAETLFVSGDGSKYRILNYDDKVFNADATNFLYDFANSGGGVLEQMLKNVLSGAGLDGITPTIVSNEIKMGDIIVQGNANERTVSEIRRAQRESVNYMLREFNKLNN